MEVLLLAIYGFFVWLIFFKFKWLPWSTSIAVVVITIPIFALAATVLLLNIVAPAATDVQVLKYVVQIIPRVTGRVIEVPVEPNRLVKKGDVLFKIDPRPFEYEVNRLKALLATTAAGVGAQKEEVAAADAQIEVSKNRVSSLQGSIEATRVRLQFAEMRVGQTTQLAKEGAGEAFEAERWESEARQHRADLEALISQLGGAQQDVAASTARAGALRQKLTATYENEQADVAQVRAQLADAQWKLDETVVYAPADGWVINLQVRPGQTVSQLPLNPVMSFVEQEHVIIALFGQNELHQVEPGNDAEIILATYPGRVIKTKVDSIIWAQGQGQMPITGVLPNTGPVPTPDGRFAVKLVLADKEKDLFLAAGARGSGAIYTHHAVPIHLIRKVIVRVSAYFDYIIIKHHISLH